MPEERGEIEKGKRKERKKEEKRISSRDFLKEQRGGRRRGRMV